MSRMAERRRVDKNTSSNAIKKWAGRHHEGGQRRLTAGQHVYIRQIVKWENCKDVQ